MRKILSPLLLVVVTFVVTLVCFGATSYAFNVAGLGDAAAVDPSWQDMLTPIYNAIVAGHFLAAAATALVLAVALIKRYAKGKTADFVHSDAGGAVLTLGGAFGAALGSAAVNQSFSWAMLITAGHVAFVAAGGYVLVKKLLIGPVLKPLAAKAPLWMQPIFAIVFWVFDRPDANADAAAAGDAAVAAKPAEGITAVTGKPTEI